MAYRAVKTSDFMQDVDEIVGYIAGTLANPVAASALLDELDKEVALLERQPNMRLRSRDTCLQPEAIEKA